MLLNRIFALALLPSFFIVPTALASNHTVSPLLIDHTVEERDIITETITITNTHPKHMKRYYVSVHEVAVDSGGAIQEFVSPSMSDRTNTVTSWMEITRSRIQLDPGESREIPLTIRINPNAEHGRYHAFIGFGEANTHDDAVKQVMAGQAPGVLVRISLDEKRNNFLRLARFAVDRFVTDSETEVVHYDVENPGDDPLVPGGEIIFYDSRGFEIGSTEVNPDGASVSPGETTSFNASVPVERGYGRHKAFLSLEYGTDQTASLHDTTFFYIVPIKLLLIIFGVVLLFSILLALWLHKRYDASDDDLEEIPDHEAVPLQIREGKNAPDQDHDLDLKQHVQKDQ